MNYFRTALLLAVLTAFFLAIGYLLGGQSGLVIALLFALGMNLFAYWNSDQMVLRMSNAHEVGPQEAPELYGIVQELPAAPACRCRGSTSSTRTSPTPSPPAAAPSMPRSR